VYPRIIVAATPLESQENVINNLIVGERVQSFWDAYATSARSSVKEFVVVRFGDCIHLADELATQVVAGKKRATTSLLRDFTELGRRIPEPGDFIVVIDGKNTPRCIVCILQVEIKALGEVDETFAWDEGGGDRSLQWWRSAHARYFKRRGVREGFAVNDHTQVILARFEVVWPLLDRL
jgi:uncharacterized protein YhfF